MGRSNSILLQNLSRQIAEVTKRNDTRNDDYISKKEVIMKRIKSSKEIIDNLQWTSKSFLTWLTPYCDRYLHQHEKDNRWLDLSDPGDKEPRTLSQQLFQDSKTINYIYLYTLIAFVVIIGVNLIKVWLRH